MSTPFRGIYPILYAFFGPDGRLDEAAMRKQVRCCLAGGAHGLAVLGLATEVNKLSPVGKEFSAATRPRPGCSPRRRAGSPGPARPPPRAR